MDVYTWQQEQQQIGNRVDGPLTQLHISLENYEKMIVRTAVNVFSEPIEKVMETFDNTEGNIIKLCLEGVLD